MLFARQMLDITDRSEDGEHRWTRTLREHIRMDRAIPHPEHPHCHSQRIAKKLVVARCNHQERIVRVFRGRRHDFLSVAVCMLQETCSSVHCAPELPFLSGPDHGIHSMLEVAVLCEIPNHPKARHRELPDPALVLCPPERDVAGAILAISPATSSDVHSRTSFVRCPFSLSADSTRWLINDRSFNCSIRAPQAPDLRRLRVACADRSSLSLDARPIGQAGSRYAGCCARRERRPTAQIPALSPAGARAGSDLW